MNPQDPQTPPIGQPQPPSSTLPPLGATPDLSASSQPSAPQPQTATQPGAPSYPPSSLPTPQPAYPPVQPQYQGEQYSIDYLNQIAPKEQKTVNRFAVFGLIGAVIVSALVAVILLANSGGPNTNELLPPLEARIATLQSVTSAQQDHLSENDISEANAALSSTLTSLDTNLQSIMKERGVKKLSSKAAITKEKTYSDALAKTLDDAYQRGTLDRTYTSNMTYQLSILNSMIAKVRKSTSNSELKQFCDSATDSITVVLKAYADFDATKQ